MKIGVIYYSLSGNNELLAKAIADSIEATKIKVVEEKKRSIKAIILDNVFNRNPKSTPSCDILDKFDLIIYFAPVWMDKIASPLRRFLKYQRKNKKPYCFFTISGGALGENLKAEKDLIKYTDTKPIVFQQYYVADLMKDNQEINMKTTSKYQLTLNDVDLIKPTIIHNLQKANII